MAKKYIKNLKLEFAYQKVFSSLLPSENILIHDAIILESGINLPKNQMELGEYPVFGGGGITASLHNAFNIDYKTIGIGRVGARCGCIFDIPPKSWVTDNALYIKSYDKRFYLPYIKHYINHANLNQYANNAMQPVISKTRIQKVTIPLINYDEQMKIAELLNSLENYGEINDDGFEAIIDEIQIVDDWQDLTVELSNQSKLILQLRQSILQEAIEGKMTAQWRKENPDIESASILLEKIKDEKEQLIKDKKIPKQKSLIVFNEDEIPFDVPENWKWCNIDYIVIMTRGSSPRPIEHYITDRDDGVNWIRIGDTADVVKYIYKTNQKITKEGAEKSQKVIENDFILSNSMSFGKPFIVKTSGYIHDGWFLIRLIYGIDMNFFYYLLLSNFIQEQFISSASGAVVQNIRADLVKKTLLALPPYEEQKEIAKRIDNLFKICDELENKINESKVNTKMLMQAVLKEAFEN